MRNYPSSQSIPSAAPERICLALWIISSVSVMIADWSWFQTDPSQKEAILSHLGQGLLFCALPAPIGILLRRRRLKRIAERNALIASLANPS